jgi:hypothetical protein
MDVSKKIFYFLFLLLFSCTCLLCSLFSQKCRKNKIQDKSIENFLSVYHRFYALTLIDHLTHLATSNIKTRNIKVVGLPFLFLLDIWNASFR